MPALLVKKLNPLAQVPKRGSELAVGYDLTSVEECVVEPYGGRKVIKTGIAICIPDNTYARVAPRSGLACHSGIDVGAGVIDPDYTGEIQIVLFNHGNAPFCVDVGDRIAQLILEVVRTPLVIEVDDLPAVTQRGSNGFGSTGTGVLF